MVEAAALSTLTAKKPDNDADYDRDSETWAKDADCNTESEKGGKDASYKHETHDNQNHRSGFHTEAQTIPSNQRPKTDKSLAAKVIASKSRILAGRIGIVFLVTRASKNPFRMSCSRKDGETAKKQGKKIGVCVRVSTSDKQATDSQRHSIREWASAGSRKVGSLSWSAP